MQFPTVSRHKYTYTNVNKDTHARRYLGILEDTFLALAMDQQSVPFYHQSKCCTELEGTICGVKS